MREKGRVALSKQLYRTKLNALQRWRKQKQKIERGGDEKRILRVLELCAGSGAFSSAVERICKKLGIKCKVYRLDIDSSCTVEIVADIEKWTCHFKPGFFDIIWCSPPCTNYSNAKTVGKRNLASADRVAKY